MQGDKELELLRQYFYNDKDDCKLKNKALKHRILEIQKKNKLKRKIMYIQSCLSVGDEKEFMEILKELGYEG